LFLEPFLAKLQNLFFIVRLGWMFDFGIFKRQTNKRSIHVVKRQSITIVCITLIERLYDEKLRRAYSFDREAMIENIVQ